MTWNKHFKNIILTSLLRSPAWGLLLDAVLKVVSEGASFFTKFPLFLGFGRDGSPVDSLPSPVDVATGVLNPIYVKPGGVSELINTVGFTNATRTETLEMLPTGLGRLDCTSHYMFFKVLRALGVGRSKFMYFSSSFQVLSNSRIVESFLKVTHDLGGGLYAYESLSPLMDGDVLLSSDGFERVIESFSTEFFYCDYPLVEGYYSINRKEGLIPRLTETSDSFLLWSYPGVPSQLVYDRYSPVSAYGTSLYTQSLSSLTVRCGVVMQPLVRKFWFVKKHVLDNAFTANQELTELILSTISLYPPSYKFTNYEWTQGSYGILSEQVVLCRFASVPILPVSVNPYQFNIDGISDLFGLVVGSLPVHTTNDDQVFTDLEDPIFINLSGVPMSTVDASVSLFFDTRQDFEFGFFSGFVGSSFFRWASSTKKATFGGRVFSLVGYPVVTSLTMTIFNSVVSISVNGVLLDTFQYDPSDSFKGFKANSMVYSVKFGSLLAYASSKGVTVNEVLRPELSVSKVSGVMFASFVPTPYLNPHRMVVCGSNYQLRLYNLGVKVYIDDSFDVSWDGLFFSWKIKLIQS